MWNSITSFARRHRRKFYVIGGIIGGVYVFRRVLASKLSEWENRQTQTFLDQMKRYHHFEGTLQTCDQTVLSLVPNVRENIQNVLKVDQLIEQLKTNPEKKLEIWEDLKILVFCETIGEICGEVLLVSFLRVQLSVIGGYMYIDTQKQGKGDKPLSNSPLPLNGSLRACSQEVQQKYLGCINHFFNIGIRDLIMTVRDAVQESFKDISLKDRMTISDFQNILATIKQSLLGGEKSIITNVASFLLPRNGLEIEAFRSGPSVDNSSTTLHKMLLETRDVIETEDFGRILTEGIELGFSSAIDRVSESMMSANQGEFVNPHQMAVPVAKIIPALHSHYKTYDNCSGSDKNSFLQQLLQLEKSKAFAANIYEAFSQPLDVDQNIRPSISNFS